MLNEAANSNEETSSVAASETEVREVIDSIRRAFASAERREEPYRHWLLSEVLPPHTLTRIAELPFRPIEEKNTDGTRESKNAYRNYFGHQERQKFTVADAVARAFQSDEVTETIEKGCDVSLDNSYLRIEYAQDTDGFWLVPHTDIGVKLFTMLLYLSDDPRHADLGTDIYADRQTHWGRSPFAPNLAMIFVPSDNTWHGFEPRPIAGVRRSLIINYVKPEWRAREQLAFPEAPIRTA